MRSRRQFILSLFFSAILVLPVLAIAILQLGQAYIQSTREERLETEHLVEVTVPVKNLVWEEEGKELWVGDRMFDVAAFYMKDGNYHLTGVYDDDETEIAGSLLHSIFSKDGSDLLRLLLLLQCFSACIVLMQLTYHQFHKVQTAFYFSFLPSPLRLVLGPPPRIK